MGSSCIENQITETMNTLICRNVSAVCLNCLKEDKENQKKQCTSISSNIQLLKLDDLPWALSEVEIYTGMKYKGCQNDINV